MEKRRKEILEVSASDPSPPSSFLLKVAEEEALLCGGTMMKRATQSLFYFYFSFLVLVNKKFNDKKVRKILYNIFPSWSVNKSAILLNSPNSASDYNFKKKIKKSEYLNNGPYMSWGSFSDVLNNLNDYVGISYISMWLLLWP